MAEAMEVIPYREQAPQLGRRPKFTHSKVDEICGYIAEGMFTKTACELAGVSENRFYTWRRQAERAKHPNRLQRYFLQSLKRAEAEAEAFHIRKLAYHAQDDWRASAFYLERKHRDRWGREAEPDANRSPQRDAPIVQQSVLVVLFFAGWALAGTFAMFMATVPAETVPPRYIATAMGFVMGMLYPSGVRLLERDGGVQTRMIQKMLFLEGDAEIDDAAADLEDFVPGLKAGPAGEPLVFSELR